MRIVPLTIPFNPNRLFYKIGNTSIYANKGKGTVNAANDIIYIKGLKNIGLRTDSQLSNEKVPRIIIKDSSISSIYGNENHHVFLHNCIFTTKPKQKLKFEPIAQIIYTNRP